MRTLYLTTVLLGLATAPLVVPTPADAAIVTRNYSVSGVLSGTFSLDEDTTTLAFTLTAANLTLGSTLFDLSNTGFQPAILGGTVSDVNGITTGAGVDDFYLVFGAEGPFPQPGIFDYFIAGSQGIVESQLAVTLVPDPVPEPATWGMMMVGFAGIGFVIRRRRKPALAQVA